MEGSSIDVCGDRDNRSSWCGRRIRLLDTRRFRDPYRPNDLFDLRARLSLAKGEGDLLSVNFDFFMANSSHLELNSAKF
jgi:hypothetical protein